MPNLLVHLAAAKRYADKNHMKDDEAREFFSGNVFPDIKQLHPETDKNQSHYYNPAPEKFTLENFGKNRVNFKRFFSENKIQTPFEKGVLFHLIVDNFCYPAVLDMKRYLDIINSGIRPRWVVTGTFNSIVNYLKEKYEIDFEMTGVKDIIDSTLARWAHEAGEIPHFNLLDDSSAIKRLDDFIEEISNINLEEFRRKYD